MHKHSEIVLTKLQFTETFEIKKKASSNII